MKSRDSKGRFIKKNSEKAEKKSKKGSEKAEKKRGRRRDSKGRYI